MSQKPTILLTALVAASLALSTAPRIIAHEGESGDDHQRGGEVEGTEDLEQEVLLTATPDAPAGAKGKAELKATNNHGVSSAILKLEVEGLAAGTYSVSVTSLADPTIATVLGSFDVAAVTTGGEDGADGDNHDGEHHGGTDDAAGAPTGSTPPPPAKHDAGEHQGGGDDGGSEVVFGSVNGVAFPANFNPLDIGTVTISTPGTTDANGAPVAGVALLTGSFAAAPTTTFAATVQVQAGAGAPAATGIAVVKATVKKKVLSQRFALAAHNLPKSTAVTVTFNGAQKLKARTTSKGNLGVTRLPRGVAGHHLTSVEIDDAAGAHLGSAHF